MPRPKSEVPRLVAKQERQAKYRAKLREAGRPEVSAVDVAVANAVGEAHRQLTAGRKSGQIRAGDPRGHLLTKIEELAAKLLVDSGCSKEQAQAQIAHRFQAPRKRRSPPITS